MNAINRYLIRERINYTCNTHDSSVSIPVYVRDTKLLLVIQTNANDFVFELLGYCRFNRVEDQNLDEKDKIFMISLVLKDLRDSTLVLVSYSIRGKKVYAVESSSSDITYSPLNTLLYKMLGRRQIEGPIKLQLS